MKSNLLEKKGAGTGDKNFGLSETVFLQMLENLHRGDETIYQTVFLQHFDDCVAFIKQQYGAAPEDAYDASMEAMVQFCKRLRSGKIRYGNLRFLFTQMAGQIYIRWIKKEALKRNLDQDNLPCETPALDGGTLEILQKAWDQLTDKSRELLTAFYYQQMTLKEYAALKGKTPAAVRKQKERSVAALRQHFKGW